MLRRFIIPLLFLPLVACNPASQLPIEPGAKPDSTPEKTMKRFDASGVKISPAVPGQRFAITNSPLVAFDTHTGALCMTYGWSTTSPSWSMGEYGEGMMTCPDLVERYPMPGETTMLSAAKR
jgi:hypothetical protein